jgi:hypothetical protein
MKKYKGVKKIRQNGRIAYQSTIMINGIVNSFGCHDNPRDAARDYDLYVIRLGLKRKTNFFKKKLV